MYYELVNTIQDAKKETMDRNTFSHPDTHIHEVSKDTGPHLSHMLPAYVKYETAKGTNHTCSNARISLPKTSILKWDKT